MKLANVQDCVWTVTHCVHVFHLQVLVHMLQKLALRTKLIGNALNIGGLLMIIVEIWNHLFCVFVPRILPAAGLLWYLVEWWMEKWVFYPVQCGFKHMMWDRERERERKFFFCPLPCSWWCQNSVYNSCSFPSSQKLELCYINHHMTIFLYAVLNL